TKINFVLDTPTLLEMGIALEESPASIKVTNARLRTGLRAMLGQFNLSYTILGDRVLITSEEMAVYRQLRPPVSLDLDGTPLRTALNQLARQTAVNLLLDPRAAKEAQTPLTVRVDDVPLEAAVRLLAEFAGLKPARMGNVLLVTTEERADKLRAEPELVPVPK